MNQTVFGDLKQRALAVYRVQTQSSTYLLGIHETRGRKFVIVRGEPGTDRELVVVRDGDPRIGERSLFEVPVAEWVGKELEVATMTTSTIVGVTAEHDPAAIQAVGVDGKLERNPWARPDAPPSEPAAFQAPRPPGFPANPRIVPSPAHGTHPVLAAAVSPAHGVAKQVVVGAPAQPSEPEIPYPERHVRYAENIAALLRSIVRRDRLFDDMAAEQRIRLRRALDDAALLLEQIRRRDRK